MSIVTLDYHLLSDFFLIAQTIARSFSEFVYANECSIYDINNNNEFLTFENGK